MKRAARPRLDFGDKPKIVPLDEHDASDDAVKLYVYSVEHDARVGRRAEVACWNGKLLDRRQVTLDSQLDCRRFARSVEEQDHSIDTQKVLRALAQANDVLAAELRVEAAASGAAEGGGTGLTEQQMKELEDKSADLAEDPDLMERLDQAFDQQGLVGEDKNARLGYLAATARLFKRPTNLAFKGQSSTGKSNLLDAILNLLPETAYFNYTTVSQKYLAYTRDNLSHAIVVIYEARGMGDDEALAYMVRSLLSEGQVVVGTVVKDDDGNFVAQKVVKPGPTALFTTSTLPELDADMETRLLSPHVDESVEQTQRIVLSAAQEYESPTERVVADRDAFIALQLWLQHCGKQRVVIPYASAVAKKLATEALRVRRDVHKLFTLVAASALLHQRQRSEVHDAVVATIRDYEIVYPLLADTMTASQQGGLTERLRAVVAVVQDVCAKNPEAKTTGVNVSTIARALKLNTSTVWRRVEVLEREGYLRNLEERPRRPARLVLGEELPAPNSAMPHPSEIVEEGEL